MAFSVKSGHGKFSTPPNSNCGLVKCFVDETDDNLKSDAVTTATADDTCCGVVAEGKVSEEGLVIILMIVQMLV